MHTLCYPATKPIRVTEPTFTQEPIGLTEARKQVGIADDVSYHDADLTGMISAARAQVEHDSGGLVCFTGSFTWKFSDFPCEDFIPIYGVRPITAISSITYVDTAGTTQTWSSSYYSLKTASLVPSIWLVYGYVWPVVRGDQEGVTVTLTAGYANLTSIPWQVKSAVRLKLHELWKLEQGEDTKGIVEGYERMMNLIGRSDYA
jgi:uncharacterized phiE125 gp8 family phage protein